MPSRLMALRAEREQALKDARGVVEKNPGSWRDNAKVQAEYDGHVGVVTRIDEEIGREQKLAELEVERRADEEMEDKIDRKAAEKGLPAKAKQEIVDIYHKWMREGEKGITAEEWQKYRATMSTTTGSEGGFTVPSLIANQLIDSAKQFGAMLATSTILPTADGKPLSMPTSDGTAEVGELIAQNTTATAADPTFGTVSLNVFKYSSKIVAAPFELLQDSVIDIESFINRRLAQRIGRIWNQHFTTGTGGGAQPDGIIPRSTVGKTGTTGQTLSIIFDDLIDVIHSVDPAYRQGGSPRFMTNDSLLKVIRKLKDSQQRPLWIPSWERGIAGTNEMTQRGFLWSDSLLGYPLIVNNDIAVPAANAVTLIFGDLSWYYIRNAMDVQMFRFADSAYIKLGQIGFLAWARAGGNLLDLGATRTYKHSAT